MIPNIQPPPLWLPQGWTPSALRSTDAIIQQVASDMSVDQATDVLKSALVTGVPTGAGITLIAGQAVIKATSFIVDFTRVQSLFSNPLVISFGTGGIRLIAVSHEEAIGGTIYSASRTFALEFATGENVAVPPSGWSNVANNYKYVQWSLLGTAFANNVHPTAASLTMTTGDVTGGSGTMRFHIITALLPTLP